MLYFFKSNNNWILGQNPVVDLVKSGTYRLQSNGGNNVSLIPESRNYSSYQFEITDVAKNSDGDKYASLSEFISATSDFFADAPALTGAPKWLTYKALLTQSGEDAPVARVLNQDEPDYLGDIEWQVDEITEFVTIKSVFNEFNPLMTIPSINNSSDRIVSFIVSGKVYFAGLNQYELNYVEIKVRKRGTAPVILSAETNEAGNKVILTFDKKMNNYGILYTDFINTNLVENAELTSDKVIELSLTTPFVNTDEITLDYSGTSIESFDYGLLEQFEGYPIVNNVVAPE